MFRSIKIIFAGLVLFFSQHALAVDRSHNCVVNEVGVYDRGNAIDRVHIRCANPYFDGNNIYYFALPLHAGTESSAFATHLINLGNTALANGRQLTIVFVAGDTSGATYGCQSINCRKPQELWLH